MPPRRIASRFSSLGKLITTIHSRPPVEGVLPALPVELVLQILEMGVGMDRSTAFVLMHVSKQVRMWVEPILYEVVTLKSSADAKKFISVFKARNRTSRRFLTQIVKRLVFLPPYEAQAKYMAFFLKTFPNITSLSWMLSNSGAKPSAWEKLIQSRKSGLTQANVVWGMDANQPRLLLPQQLTHLAISIDIDIIRHREEWLTAIKNVPSLTHLVFSFYAFDSWEEVMALSLDADRIMHRLPRTIRRVTWTLGLQTTFIGGWDEQLFPWTITLAFKHPRLVLFVVVPEVLEESWAQCPIPVLYHSYNACGWGRLRYGCDTVWGQTESVLKERGRIQYTI
ncbi:hypothetical protein CYLTODRAFT_417304 [Cylindrobasidium torrendii FP15055 ss-10]|uniref:Uncharacterized protein n=1 Tax=Cylindrobasidium torrendii FP15055 ss-10 TaxID=1314674 RepID=A0A0D7BTV1_9AGAR|nr:hypothetical protein CYLTODRAFT_417304 [Cylindrobasidium torrendii FP15055 ss-10]